jgi:hypothetical protein
LVVKRDCSGKSAKAISDQRWTNQQLAPYRLSMR